ncbi:MAG: DASS family sodium-coupled anion symporter [Candidatus Neomarinimicrobiota bacterium]
MIKSVIYWSYQKRWLLFALLLGTLLYFLPYPKDLSPEGYRALIITLVVVILIISEAVPLPATGILIAVLQVLLGLGEPTQVAQSYASDSVFFIMGSLMLAVAIVRQGLDARLTLGILTVTGNRVKNIMWGFFVISVLLTSFMGEHTIVAMMLPVALTLVRNTGMDERELRELMRLFLFALAFGSVIGSFGTPSGGARNAIMIGYLSDFGLGQMSYLRWIIFAYPLLLIQIPIGGWLLTRTFKPELDSLDSAVRKLKVQVGRTGPLSSPQMLAIALFLLILLGWIFLSDILGIGIIALAGVFLYLATGLVQWTDINQRTNWGVVLLYAGAISLGLQLKNTGAAMWMAQLVVQGAGGLLEQLAVVQYALVISLSTLVVNIMSPSATVAVLGPMFINFGGHPVLLGMATAIASAFGYLTAVGSSAGMIIASTGLLKPRDFLRAGWRFTLMSIGCLLLAMMFYWPLLVE